MMSPLFKTCITIGALALMWFLAYAILSTADSIMKAQDARDARELGLEVAP